MQHNILKIKNHIPPMSRQILPRAQLVDLIEADLLVSEGFTRGITLVSAPAGFGKTTLVRKWLSGREEQTAWYSLDEGDNDPLRYWIYLISALQKINEDIGKGSLEILRSGTITEGDTSLETLLTPFLNDLYGLNSPITLVLDDYHWIHSSEIHQQMVFFIENLPPSLHLAVTTRSDPPWPLFRWRGKGILLDVRLKDLKFTEAETAQLFIDTFGITLSSEQVRALLSKSEGWVTGLRLAVASLSRSEDPDRYIEGFTGSGKHVFHFLSEEVFEVQPPDIQEFLLYTSVLNRFCGSLCDAITERMDSEAVLAGLERDNLFVISLDAEGQWYRYHHLFGDFLLLQLKKRSPEVVQMLHERASQWFLQVGEPGEAFRHALAGGSQGLAAVIAHDQIIKVVVSQGPRAVKQFLDTLPAAVLKSHPRLIPHKCIFNMLMPGMDDSEEWLKTADTLRYEDPGEQEAYAGILSAAKAYYHINTGDYPMALYYAEKVRGLTNQENSFWGTGVMIFSGDVRLFLGDPKGALAYYREAYESNQKRRELYYAISTGFKTATALFWMGDFKESEAIVLHQLHSAKEGGFPTLGKVGLLWGLLAELKREQGELDEAERCIQRGLGMSEPDLLIHAWVTLSEMAVSFSRQEMEGVLRCADSIQKTHEEAQLPPFVTAPAMIWKAQALLASGDKEKALCSLEQMGIVPKAGIQKGLERGFLTLARILEDGPQEEKHQGLAITEEILVQGGQGRYQNLVMEALLRKSCLEEKLGNGQRAQETLHMALHMGHESGYYQSFLDEGAVLAPILSRLLDSWTKGASVLKEASILTYARRIFDAVSPEQAEIAPETPSPEAERVKKTLSGSYPGLVEALSEREMEILDLIGQGLSNQDICDQLYLSMGTVKWHTSNIYGKLGVKGRTQAVALARKHQMLS